MNTNKMEFAKPNARLQLHLLPKPFEKKRDHRNKSRTTSENEITTIEDDLKAIYFDGNDVNSKTHVSILQEVLFRHGTTANYELVRIEGMRHEPTFKYRVWFNDKDAIGSGKSKKEAKHSASKALIDKLTGVGETNTTTTLTSELTSNINDLNSSWENNVFGNAIGWLQELCTARHWAPPMYEIDFVAGRPHERQFLISCVVFKHREVGHGKSKKMAKLLAAHKVWVKLQKEIYAKSKANQDLEDDGFFELSPSKPSIALNTDDVNCIQYLQDFAASNKIEVNYKHIETKTIAGRFQCLVQLSTHPETNCHGTGISKTEAHLNAAHNAVVYLKSLCLFYD